MSSVSHQTINKQNNNNNNINHHNNNNNSNTLIISNGSSIINNNNNIIMDSIYNPSELMGEDGIDYSQASPPPHLMTSPLKVPDRSTSAPPILALQTESLFAFRATEHLHLFSDIRCDENYLDFYQRYEGDREKLPRPLEIQPFLTDQRVFGNKHSLPLPAPPNNLAYHQNPNEIIHGIVRGLQSVNVMNDHEPLLSDPSYRQGYLNDASNPPPPPGSSSGSSSTARFMLNNDARNFTIGRSPQYMESPQFHNPNVPSPVSNGLNVPPIGTGGLQRGGLFSDGFAEGYDHLDEVPNGSASITHQAENIWTPLPRKMANLVLEDDQDDSPSHHPIHTHHASPTHNSQAPNVIRRRTPGEIYGPSSASNSSASVSEAFEVAFSTANQLLKEDNLQSLWASDNRSYQQQQQQQQQQQGQTPIRYRSPPIGTIVAGNSVGTLNAPMPNTSNISPIMSLLAGSGSHHQQQPHQPYHLMQQQKMLMMMQQQQQQQQQGDDTYFGDHSQHPETVPSLPLSNSPPSSTSTQNIVTTPTKTSPRGVSSIRTSPPNAVAPQKSPSPPLASGGNSNQICRYFQSGYCSRGDRCNFLHTNEQGPTSPTLEANQDRDKESVNNSIGNITVTVPPGSVLSAQDIIAQQKAAAVVAAAKQRKGIGLSNTNVSQAQENTSQSNHSPSRTNNSQGSPQSQVSIKGRHQKGGNSPLSPTTEQLGVNSNNYVNNNSNNISNNINNSNNGTAKHDFLVTKQYTSFEQVQGQIYHLCKDQHGCRFLQKKLEERDAKVTESIFEEIYEHVAELMTDPFGNYLCQKLLEHCNDEQRLMIIDKVGPELVKISKNMHGTRAVQKMIEFLTTPEQIALVKKALAYFVVPLIQDLNGNHVVQRCLNKLSPADNQFIYDSVSQEGHCVEVATHRHGCCVLQRCIDHASDTQKLQLIGEIISNALVLVQDPYGNYVVQYVLDLPFPGLASRLAKQFLGHVPILSTQKFSSNVIEKCLNVADVPTRALLIQELVEYDNLLYLLQDPYANYVIQTSLGMSEPLQHTKLVEAIRPHLAALRNTPYGKRIQNKILKESQREYYQ